MRLHYLSLSDSLHFVELNKRSLKHPIGTYDKNIVSGEHIIFRGHLQVGTHARSIFLKGKKKLLQPVLAESSNHIEAPPMSDLPLRPRSQRLSARTHRYGSITKHSQKPTEIFPGLNDVTDAFEALPLDIIRYFTLLKEIDAKCVSLVPALNYKISKFKATSNRPELKQKRTAQIQEISKLIKDLLPCLEEKMHVASIAADKTVTYIDRINDDFELVFKNEIPESIKYGPVNHPAILTDPKGPDNKSAQSQRSESRREALAAKKAANGSQDDEKASASSSSRAKGRKDREGTPLTVATTPTTTSTTTTTNNKKRKTTSSTPSVTPALQHAATQSVSQALREETPVSRPGTPSTANKRRQTQKKKPVTTEEEVIKPKTVSSDEPLYCYCNQVSYGEMVGCDGDDCKREWFHLPCIGLATLPKGKWYCDECTSRLKKQKKL